MRHEDQRLFRRRRKDGSLSAVWYGWLYDATGKPSMSAYTYAVAFTVDEAVSAGASHVQFSQPVYGYLENFLSFPVGMTMPSGSYDTVSGRWLPESNGRVIQILSITNGSAVLDTNGDGQADDASTLAALGVSNSELVTLAGLYPAGQTLWRVPMLHFSWEDWNVGLGIPGFNREFY